MILKTNKTQAKGGIMATLVLALELVDNGETAKSLISDDGTIYGSGFGLKSCLREAAFLASERGYSEIEVDFTRYNCESLKRG